MSYAFTAWGQFLTHDIIQTPDASNGRVKCSCKRHPLCKQIKLYNDPVFEFDCLFITRSGAKLGSQNGKGIREQMNQVSAFIDGSVLYGFTTKHKNMLLHRDKMHLKMHMHPVFGEFLPTMEQMSNAEAMSSFKTSPDFNDKRLPDSISGDTRVMENAGPVSKNKLDNELAYDSVNLYKIAFWV